MARRVDLRVDPSAGHRATLRADPLVGRRVAGPRVADLRAVDLPVVDLPVVDLRADFHIPITKDLTKKKGGHWPPFLIQSVTSLRAAKPRNQARRACAAADPEWIRAVDKPAVCR